MNSSIFTRSIMSWKSFVLCQGVKFIIIINILFCLICSCLCFDFLFRNGYYIFSNLSTFSSIFSTWVLNVIRFFKWTPGMLTSSFYAMFSSIKLTSFLGSLRKLIIIMTIIIMIIIFIIFSTKRLMIFIERDEKYLRRIVRVPIPLIFDDHLSLTLISLLSVVHTGFYYVFLRLMYKCPDEGEGKNIPLRIARDFKFVYRMPAVCTI